MNRLALTAYILSGLFSILMCLAFPDKVWVIQLWAIAMATIAAPLELWRRRAQPRELKWVLNGTLLHLIACTMIALIVTLIVHRHIPHLSYTTKGFCLFASGGVWLTILAMIYTLFRRDKKNYNL